MHYLYSIMNNSKWYDQFSDVGYATLVDMRTGSTVLMTHGDDDGHLPCIERHNEWELLAQVDQVACCFPGVVQQRYPMLNVLGDWREVTNMTCLYSQDHGVHYVELMSDSELYERCDL